MEDMELKVQEVTLPDIIAFNYEELKAELQSRCEFYETVEYSEANMKKAKSDKAMLNKLKKALNDERIAREKEYMKPFNEFKTKVNELIGIIDKPVALIDSQVKAFEAQLKEQKKQDIIALFASMNPPQELEFVRIFDIKWLNASTEMSKIKSELQFIIDNFNANIKILSDLPEFGFEATQTYISTLDLQKALNEANRLSEMARLKAEREEAKRKEEERIKAEEEAKRKAEETMIEEVKVEEPVAEVVAEPVEDFTAFPEEEVVTKYIQVSLTASQFAGLKLYMVSNGIEFSEI